MLRLTIFSALTVISTYSQTPMFCTNPRPTDETCPDVLPSTSASTPPDYCGITRFSQKKPFQISCLACKDTRIMYYYKEPCQFIGPGHHADLDEVFSKLGISAISCFEDFECEDWEICSKVKRICVDRCWEMECSGICERGKCHQIKKNDSATGANASVGGGSSNIAGVSASVGGVSASVGGVSPTSK